MQLDGFLGANRSIENRGSLSLFISLDRALPVTGGLG